MVLICPICVGVRVAALHQLMTHIRVMHADEPQFMIQCNLQGCKRTFRKFTVYRNHVYAFHDTSTVDQDDYSLEPDEDYQDDIYDEEFEVDGNGEG